MKLVSDERISPLTISNEAVLVPSAGPFVARLDEVPVDGSISVRRITEAVKTGVGYGTLESGGYFTGLTAKDYLIEIDTAGQIGVSGATFKWSTDAGATWRSTLIPIEDTDPYVLELGVQFTPVRGSITPDFSIGDQFTFTAEVWEEETAIPLSSMQYQIDYANGDILFVSADAGKTVYVSYSGKGSLADAGPINEMVAAYNSGNLSIRDVDTSSFFVGEAVGVEVSGGTMTFFPASTTHRAVGLVSVVDAVNGEVMMFGILDGFVNLVPQTPYNLASLNYFGQFTDYLFTDQLHLSNNEDYLLLSVTVDGGFLYGGGCPNQNSLPLPVGSFISRLQLPFLERRGGLSHIDSRDGWIDVSSAGCNALVCDGDYIYGALECIPARVVKLEKENLQNLSGTWTAGAGEGSCKSIILLDGYLYAAVTTGSVIKIYKIDPSTMLTSGTPLSITSTDSVVCLASDGINVFSGFNSTPTVVKKINSSLSILASWTGTTGQNNCSSLVYNDHNLFVGLKTSPAQVVKLNSETMVTISGWTGDSGTNQNIVAALIMLGGYLFVGTGVGAGWPVSGSANRFLMIKIDPLTMVAVGNSDWDALSYICKGHDRCIATDGASIYLGVDYTSYAGVLLFGIYKNLVKKINPLDCNSSGFMFANDVQIFHQPDVVNYSLSLQQVGVAVGSTQLLVGVSI